MNKEEILEQIAKIQEVTKDYNLFKHLFSEDVGVKTFAELNQTLGNIKFLLTVNELKEIAHPKNKVIMDSYIKEGSLIKIRPCGSEYENKTYLGYFIGDIATGSSLTITDDKIQCNWAGHNPGIFVPELGKIIYGCESWWSKIDSEEELNQITDDDISNVWYVKLLKKQMEESKQNLEEEKNG